MTTSDRLTAPPHLSGRHQHTYDAIFRHPTAHNLEWHDVVSLLNAMANVEEKHNGSLQVTRNGHVLTLHVPNHKDSAPIELVLDIRRFLEQSNEPSIPPPVGPGTLRLVVIDHHEAKVYRSESHGAIPRQFVPYDPHGFRRHLVSDNEETHGKRAPERKSFYEAIAATLRGADQILIFGHGTGESSAMEQLLADLKRNHADVAEHIIGSMVIDGKHLTEGQVLSQAAGVLRVKGCIGAGRLAAPISRRRSRKPANTDSSSSRGEGAA